MISHSRLLEILSYDPDTGLFTWLISPRKNTPAGSLAGSLKSHGYIRIKIDGRGYYGHRLAWFYMHGVWPPEEIDHINLVRSDNRAMNLRSVSSSQNRVNTGLLSTNTSGFKGVSWSATAKKWQAQIQAGGHITNLGYFPSPAQAHQAYVDAAKQQHGEYARP